jgi:hypothetical protein
VVKPEDLLAHAIKLMGSAGNDLDYRGVINNAYYGAYHASLRFEESLPVRSKADPQKAGTHEGLLQRLERPDPQLDYGLRVISLDIAAQMRMLKPLRELASYELGETIRVDQAEEAIRSAKDILAECAKGQNKLKTKQSG